MRDDDARVLLPLVTDYASCMGQFYPGLCIGNLKSVGHLSHVCRWQHQRRNDIDNSHLDCDFYTIVGDSVSMVGEVLRCCGSFHCASPRRIGSWPTRPLLNFCLPNLALSCSRLMLSWTEPPTVARKRIASLQTHTTLSTTAGIVARTK
jgi:hypothetical protein